eukprot:scaffold26803_cov83-Isochrysis_galbana.AAC.2
MTCNTEGTAVSEVATVVRNLDGIAMSGEMGNAGAMRMSRADSAPAGARGRGSSRHSFFGLFLLQRPTPARLPAHAGEPWGVKRAPSRRQPRPGQAQRSLEQVQRTVTLS